VPIKTIEIQELEGEGANKKQTIFFEKQGKFKVGVVPADRLGCLLLKICFVYLNRRG
jgi:uncharacterized Fe-S cluster-containing radical SAM superfamily protein